MDLKLSDLEVYQKQREALRERFIGTTKSEVLERLSSRIDSYDTDVKFLILNGLLEQKYNQIKTKNYRMKNPKVTKVARDNLINKQISYKPVPLNFEILNDYKPKIITSKLEIDIDSNLVTPSNTEPNTPKL